MHPLLNRTLFSQAPFLHQAGSTVPPSQTGTGQLADTSPLPTTVLFGPQELTQATNQTFAGVFAAEIAVIAEERFAKGPQDGKKAVVPVAPDETGSSNQDKKTSSPEPFVSEDPAKVSSNPAPSPSREADQHNASDIKTTFSTEHVAPRKANSIPTQGDSFSAQDIRAVDRSGQHIMLQAAVFDTVPVKPSAPAAQTSGMQPAPEPHLPKQPDPATGKITPNHARQPLSTPQEIKGNDPVQPVKLPAQLHDQVASTARKSTLEKHATQTPKPVSSPIRSTHAPLQMAIEKSSDPKLGTQISDRTSFEKAPPIAQAARPQQITNPSFGSTTTPVLLDTSPITAKANGATSIPSEMRLLSRQAPSNERHLLPAHTTTSGSPLPLPHNQPTADQTRWATYDTNLSRTPNSETLQRAQPATEQVLTTKASSLPAQTTTSGSPLPLPHNQPTADQTRLTTSGTNIDRTLNSESLQRAQPQTQNAAASLTTVPNPAIPMRGVTGHYSKLPGERDTPVMHKAISSVPSAPRPQTANSAPMITPQTKPEHIFGGKADSMPLAEVDSSPIIRSDGSATGQTTATQAAATRLDLPHHVARQIAEVLQHLPARPVEITLNPEELGRVRLGLSTAEAGITVHVLAERPETMDLLRRHISTLETAFEALGYSDISFSFSGNRNASGERSEDQSTTQRDGIVDGADLNPNASATTIQISPTADTGIDIRL